jgi:hypothetical protein
VFQLLIPARLNTTYKPTCSFVFLPIVVPYAPAVNSPNIFFAAAAQQLRTSSKHKFSPQTNRQDCLFDTMETLVHD